MPPLFTQKLNVLIEIVGCVACDETLVLYSCNWGVFRSAQRQYLGKVGEDVALVYNGNTW